MIATLACIGFLVLVLIGIGWIFVHGATKGRDL